MLEHEQRCGARAKDHVLYHLHRITALRDHQLRFVGPFQVWVRGEVAMRAKEGVGRPVRQILPAAVIAAVGCFEERESAEMLPGLYPQFATTSAWF